MSKDLGEKLKKIAQTGFLVPATALGFFSCLKSIEDCWMYNSFYFREDFTKVLGETGYDVFQTIAPICLIGCSVFTIKYYSNKIDKYIDKRFNQNKAR